MAVNPVPDNYPRLSPYLVVDGAAEAIAFYCSVFGFAQRGGVLTSPDGRIGHAELELDGSLVMLADEWPEVGNVGPRALGGSPVQLSIYVEDVDATHAAALAAGAESLRDPVDEFYGDRMGAVRDPWGHRWSIHSHIEDVDPDEMVRRMTEAMGDAGS